MSNDNGWTGDFTYPTATGFTLTGQEPEYVIQINGYDNQLMVGIKYDGTFVFGENYTPDAAAKLFWEAFAYNAPVVTGVALPKIDTEICTPWAVICRDHGKQYLSSEQYDDQMMKADSFWFCPVCGGRSEWDDDNFEEHCFNE